MTSMSPESSMKYCRTCGNQVSEKAIACMKCGVPPKNGKSYCYHCGGEVRPEAIVCIKCGMTLQALQTRQVNSNPIWISVLWGYFVKCLKNYATFSGRARRKEYWGFVLFQSLFSLIPFLGALWSLAVFVPALAVTWRRYHDVGLSGVLAIPILLAVSVGIWTTQIGVLSNNHYLWKGIVLLILSGAANMIIVCMNSRPGENKYGPNPKED